MPVIYAADGKPMRLAASTLSTPKTDTESKKIYVCDHSNSVIEIAEYMVGEMKKNPFTADGKKITDYNAYDPVVRKKEWDALPWYSKLGGSPDFMEEYRTNKESAMTIWYECVKSGSKWDHKPLIRKMLLETGGPALLNHGYQKYGEYDYFYDIWSNIHYGYVGVAVGFSPAELFEGAGLAQFASDIKAHGKFQYHAENGRLLSRFDDSQDHIAIQVGIDLCKKVLPEHLTGDFLLREISFAKFDIKDDGAKRLHSCKLS